VNQVSYPAPLVVVRKSSSPFDETSSPENLSHRVFNRFMIVCPGYSNITLGAYKVFIPQKMVSATIAEPGEKETYEVVPQIVNVTHAAMLNYFIKDRNIMRIEYALYEEKMGRWGDGEMGRWTDGEMGRIENKWIQRFILDCSFFCCKTCNLKEIK
jgi:hypothetical protein